MLLFLIALSRHFSFKFFITQPKNSVTASFYNQKRPLNKWKRAKKDEASKMGHHNACNACSVGTGLRKTWLSLFQNDDILKMSLLDISIEGRDSGSFPAPRAPVRIPPPYWTVLIPTRADNDSNSILWIVLVFFCHICKTERVYIFQRKNGQTFDEYLQWDRKEIVIVLIKTKTLRKKLQRKRSTVQSNSS